MPIYKTAEYFSPDRSYVVEIRRALLHQLTKEKAAITRTMQDTEGPECAEKLCFCDVPTALDEIRAGRVLVIVDNDYNLQQAAIVAASVEPTPETLNLMASSTSGFVFMMVPQIDLRRVKLPRSLERHFVLGAVFPETQNRSRWCERSTDPIFRHPIIPFTRKRSGILRHSHPAEYVVDLAELAGEGLLCFFSTFPGDAGSFRDSVRAHSLPVLSAAELVRYKSPGKEILRRSEVP